MNNSQIIHLCDCNECIVINGEDVIRTADAKLVEIFDTNVGSADRFLEYLSKDPITTATDLKSVISLINRLTMEELQAAAICFQAA